MAIQHGRTLGQKLCKVLGLDPAQVASITITADASDVVRVSVEQFATDAQGDAVALVLTDYTLTSKEEP